MHFAFHRNSAYELLLIAAVLCLYCVRKFGIHLRDYVSEHCGRIRSRAIMNDILWRAIKRAQMPAVKEPINLMRDDNKRPDGTTLLPWAKGKPMVWDVTVSDTYAESTLAAQQLNQVQLPKRQRKTR